MKNIIKQIATIAAVLAVFTLGGFVAGRMRPTPPTVETRTDTVIVRDTIREEVPVVKYSLTTRVDTVWLPIPEPPNSGSDPDFEPPKGGLHPDFELPKGGLHPDFEPLYPDSTQVIVPIERKVYQTEDYRAEVEGFRPSLVSMEIYRQTRYVDRVQTLKVPDTRRWSFGPAVGYGVTVQNGRIVGVPTVGVSVQYSVIKW